MLGIELMQPVADKVVVELLNKGFIINNIGLKILRFLPPLIVTKKEIDKLVLALQQVLKERFWEKQ
jgi:acetylornithine/succinyldiaminopimelate/putrescine aminotransferase